METTLSSSDTHNINPSMIRSTQKKREAWKRLISEWKKSSVSQRIFCESRGLNLKRFVYYRAYFRNISKQRKKLLPIEVSSDIIKNKPTADDSFTLCLPNNMRLKIPASSDKSMLKNVFSALGILS